MHPGAWRESATCVVLLWSGSREAFLSRRSSSSSVERRICPRTGSYWECHAWPCIPVGCCCCSGRRGLGREAATSGGCSPAGMALAGIALLSIGSRGPIIGAAVGLVVWVLMRGLLRARTVGVIMVAALVAVVAVDRASDAALSRLVLEDPARRELWSIARRAFVENPFGLGWGDYATISVIDEYPHNLVLELSSELGLLGLASILVLVVAVCLRAWRSRSQPEVRVVAAIAVVMLVGQQFSSDLTNRLFWIAIVPLLLLPLPGLALRPAIPPARAKSVSYGLVTGR